MRNRRLAPAIRLLLLLLTLGSGQAPLVVLRACARMPHSGFGAPGSAAHAHRSTGHVPADTRVHLCCNVCGLLSTGAGLPPTALGSSQAPSFLLSAAGTAFDRTFQGLGDVRLLPPSLGPPEFRT